MVTAKEGAETPPLKQITTRIDTKLWVRFRMILVGRGESQQEVVSDFVRRYVEHHERGAK